MIKIQKGDGLILQSGSRMIAEGRLWNRGNVLFDDWRVAAWCEDRSYRFAIQLIAITEVWRDGVRIDLLPDQTTSKPPKRAKTKPDAIPAIIFKPRQPKLF